MEKVIKDGMVAVLYSPGFGAGWFTWDAPIELVFHPKIVDMVLQNRQEEIDKFWLAENIGKEYENVYCGGARYLTVAWLPIGTRFLIDEYDGNETLSTLEDLPLITA